MYKVAAAHTGYLVNYASLKGIERDSIYTGQVGLPEDSLQEGRIEAEQFLRIFQRVAELTRDPFFGLMYGCSLNVRALAFVTHVQRHASTLEQAVFILKEYLAHSFSLIELTEKSEETHYEICLQTTFSHNSTSLHLLDAVFAFIYRELSLILPDVKLIKEICMPHHTLKPYQSMIDERVKNGEHYSFLLDAEIAKQRINTKRASDIALILPRFLQMLDKDMTSYGSFSKKVRAMTLYMCSPEVPSFEQVASQFPLSHRSFQRKLGGEGTNFRQISDHVRKEISAFMTNDPQIMTKDIAYMLGYSEPSAYLHARKRWISEG